MGNQGHSWDDGRRAVEWMQAGAIGDVREVHVWTNRPLAYWPQGIPRPQPQRIATELRWNMPGVMARLANAMGLYSVPDKLPWDLFLGPAPRGRVSPRLSPVQLARVGRLGRWRHRRHGRAPHRSRLLGARSRLPDECRDRVDPVRQVACFPMATTTYYEFPARGSMPPVKLTWYDGGLLPPKPEEIGEEPLNADRRRAARRIEGQVDLRHLRPQLAPAAQVAARALGMPLQKLPRITTSHEMNWSDAAKGKGEASTPFEYAARLTEVMLLGIVALRAGTKIHYDGAKMQITNSANGQRFSEAGISARMEPLTVSVRIRSASGQGTDLRPLELVSGGLEPDYSGRTLMLRYHTGSP